MDDESRDSSVDIQSGEYIVFSDENDTKESESYEENEYLLSSVVSTKSFNYLRFAFSFLNSIFLVIILDEVLTVDVIFYLYPLIILFSLFTSYFLNSTYAECLTYGGATLFIVNIFLTINIPVISLHISSDLNTVLVILLGILSGFSGRLITGILNLVLNQVTK